MGNALKLKSHQKYKRKGFSQSIRLELYKKSNGICFFCGKKTRWYRSSYDTPFEETETVAGSIDHIVPVSEGGTNKIDNLRWTCKSCNCSRQKKSDTEYTIARCKHVR